MNLYLMVELNDILKKWFKIIIIQIIIIYYWNKWLWFFRFDFWLFEYLKYSWN